MTASLQVEIEDMDNYIEWFEAELVKNEIKIGTPHQLLYKAVKKDSVIQFSTIKSSEDYIEEKVLKISNMVAEIGLAKIIKNQKTYRCEQSIDQLFYNLMEAYFISRFGGFRAFANCFNLNYVELKNKYSRSADKLLQICNKVERKLKLNNEQGRQC